jgi:hypothetical protein
MEHAPGPRASPQLPQGAGLAELGALVDGDFDETAKTDSCGASFLLWHLGH